MCGTINSTLNLTEANKTNTHGWALLLNRSYSQTIHPNKMSMTMNEFVVNVSSSERKTLAYLQKYGLFNISKVSCPGKLRKSCGLRMTHSFKKNRRGEELPLWRCHKTGCRKSVLVRHSNRFFTFEDKNGRPRCNISLSKIVTVVYLWAHG